MADPETFFPAPLEPAVDAVEWCRRCTVAGACLAWALSVGKDCHGVWGGTTARERRAMLVAWRTEEQPEEAAHAPLGPQPELVVAAGELCVSQRLPGQGRAPHVIPRQRRGELTLISSVPDRSMLSREPAHAA